ncbi:hypothetical protein AGDE_02325 [Angomonas deanei]|nr:hypothetical protein AGDE_02325 [Angomonas deanei]|eukprot:EPY41599.1 hypothetical protein AGDE_02325 [Angomonas deanei]
MSSGALGRGSFHSVVAGTKARGIPTFYNSTFELIQLNKAHMEVLRCFSARDKIFDNKFPGTALANGLFKMHPNKRENFHRRELLEAIRLRSIWLERIKKQRSINQALLRDASKALSEQEVQKRFSYVTKDRDLYFSPSTAVNNFPNFWQHPTEIHVVPK